MRQFFLLTIVFGLALTSTIGLFSQPDDAQRHAGKSDALIEKAFVDGQSEVISGYENRSVERRLERPYCDWQFLAIEARRAAGNLVKKHGKATGEYLLGRATNGPPSGRSINGLQARTEDMVLLLTLDALDMPDAAARSAGTMITRGGHQDVILMVSFCSSKTREAAANLLFSEWLAHSDPVAQLQNDRSKRINLGWSYLPSFLAVAGNQRTVELLANAKKEGRDRGRYPPIPDDVARHISSRLSLPPEKHAQRAKDELLCWQTMVGAPNTRNLASGLRFAAERLVANGYSVSPSYLMERIEEIKGPSLRPRPDYGPQSVLDGPVLYLVGAQKVDSAVPALVDLARSGPNSRKVVEGVLKQMGTKKAEEALRTLGADSSQPR
jgi:hypothetical protein